jgi:hypothetical protein
MNRTLKVTVAVLFVGLTVLPAISAAQQPPVGRSVAYCLEPGEEIMWAESKIAVCADSEDVVLVIRKGENGPYFVFRDGKKQGPFAKLEDAMKAAYEGKKEACEKNRDCAQYKPEPAPEDMVVSTDSDGRGGQILQFRGKTFGPHLIIFTSQVTPDGARAYYTASDKDRAWFADTDGRKTSFGGIPEDFKFSPNGKNAAAVCTGTLTMAEMENAASIPPEKLNANDDTKFLYTIDGKKFGPFNKDFSSGSFWYPANSNDLYYEIGGQLYMNGTPFLKTNWIDPCAFYPSPDGKKYALFTYENIAFSDGIKFPSPLDIVVFQEKGNTVFKWIALENKKCLVVYRRAM